MYYFVGFNLGNSITGIEKAMINRLFLFKNNNKRAKCLFLSWNRFMSKYAEKFLDKKDYINMYDYFQKSISVLNKESIDYISYWQNECNYKIKYVKNSKDIRVYKSDKFIMYVRFLDNHYKQLDYINYFDVNGKKIKREFYDVRGFLSCTRILTTNQAVLAEQYYDPNGNITIEKYFNIETNKIERIILNNDNSILFFDSETDLQAYFIESIYQYGDLFFSDKNIHTAPMFNKVNPNIPVIAVLHSTHVKNIHQHMTSRFKNVYKELFDNLSRYKAIIVSTNSQKIDVTMRINHALPVINIPVGFSIENKTNNHSLEISPLKLISVARYSPEKQLHHQIELIKALKDEFPNIELHLFGFGSENEKLANLIKEYHLEKNVFLRGFLPDLSAEYENAYLNILTSSMEGFSLALLECQSHGIPTISYDIKYGPNELVKDNKNGYLITPNDKNELIKKVKFLLKNPKIQKEFSQQSIVLAQQYSQSNIMEKWDNALQLLDK